MADGIKEVLSDEEKEKIREGRAKETLEKEGISTKAGRPKISDRLRSREFFKEKGRQFVSGAERVGRGASEVGKGIFKFEQEVEHELEKSQKVARRKQRLKRMLHRHRKRKGLTRLERRKLKMLLKKLR